MQNPLVSIGIPTYNRPILCQKAIESVLNQSYENIEIIVSDNSNNLETTTLVYDVIQKNLTSKNIIYKKQENNIGGINNFNYVLNQSNGEFFLLLEDEIILDKYFIEKAIQHLLENSDYIGVSGQFIYERNSTKEKEKTSQIMSSYPMIRSATIWSTHNTSIFFSLFRANECKAIGYRKEYVFDRTFLSHLMFKGKLHVLENCYNIRSFKYSITNQQNGYKNLFNTLKLTYYNKFFAQLLVSKYAFLSAFRNPFNKNKLIHLCNGFLNFIMSFFYIIFYQNIYLEWYFFVRKKVTYIYRSIYYLYHLKTFYKKLKIGKHYISISDYKIIRDFLLNMTQHNLSYCIYGNGELTKIIWVLIKVFKFNSPKAIIISSKAETKNDLNIIYPNQLRYIKSDFIFIASYSYKDEMLNTLKECDYQGQIVYFK